MVGVAYGSLWVLTVTSVGAATQVHRRGVPTSRFPGVLSGLWLVAGPLAAAAASEEDETLVVALTGVSLVHLALVGGQFAIAARSHSDYRQRRAQVAAGPAGLRVVW